MNLDAMFSPEERQLLDDHPRLLTEWLAETEGVKAQCLHDVRRYFGLKKMGKLEELRTSVRAAEYRANQEWEQQKAKRDQQEAIANVATNEPERWAKVQALAAKNPRFQYVLDRKEV